MLVQCHARLPAFLSPRATLSANLPAPSEHPLPVSFSAFVHFPSLPASIHGAINALFYPTDNSIILHAKTASDVLAQSASHLCEQITSYRKTDFIFEEERWSRFFFAPPRYSIPLSLPPFHLSFSSSSPSIFFLF